MIRPALVVLAAATILFLSINLIIPAEIAGKQEIFIRAPEEPVLKFFASEPAMLKWWPGKRDSMAGRTAATRTISLSFDQVDYVFKRNTYNSLSATASYKGLECRGRIEFMATGDYKERISWTYTYPTGGRNPVEKLSNVKKGRILTSNIQAVTDSLRSFLTNERNIYGIALDVTQIKDTLFVATKRKSSTRPSDADVALLLKKLRSFIAGQKVQEKGFPILNITKTGPGAYQTMVAVGIDKPVNTNDEFFIQKMVYKANLLTTEVKGGHGTIDHTLEIMRGYLSDHRLTSPAIPFQAMVTDRSSTPDTTRWITRICYPIL